MHEKIENKIPNYEERLWEKAEELFNVRSALRNELIELYSKMGKKDVPGIGLHAQDLLIKMHAKSKEIEEEIEEIRKFEDEIQAALEQLNDGKVDVPALIKLIGKEDGPKISKRKQRILEERKLLGINPSSLDPLGLEDFSPIQYHGPGAYKLTTGYHAKRIRGAIKSESGDHKDIARQFYEATRDTHGGKAKFGKSGYMYVSKTGKKIRKR